MTSFFRDERLCPTCLSRFATADVVWWGADGTQVSAPPERARGWLRHLARALNADARSAQDPTREQLAEWLARGGRPFCPAGHRLPLGFFTHPTYVLGLVGERSSSKSCYIATLIHQLLSGPLLHYGVTVELEADSAYQYRTVYGNLWSDPTHPVPELTQRADAVHAGASPGVRQPLTLTVHSAHTGRTVNVLVYDAAGEQMLDARLNALYNRFLLGADGIFLFVPPAALHGIQGLRRSADDVQTLEVTGAMFAELSDALRRMHHVTPGDPLPVATSVLLCKADTLRGLDGFDGRFAQDEIMSGYAAEAVRESLGRVSRDVQTFMLDNGGGNLLGSIATRFSHDVTFHPVSASGCAAENGRFPRLAPFRCLDPFFALLARVGVIADPQGLPVRSAS